MPAFVLISGYFSQRFDAAPQRVRRLIAGVLVPYVVFELAYTVFRRWTGGDPSAAVSLLDPWWLNWFLAALFLWRVTTPLWRSVRWPLAWALVVSVFAAMTPNVGPDLGLQRALQFAPFFVLGLLARPEHVALVRRRGARLAALPVMAGAVALAYWSAPRLDWAWFYREHSGQELGVSALTGGVMALALFGCSMLLVGVFPRLGAGPSHLVHRTRRRHALRLPAARVPHQGQRLLGLVRPRLDAQSGGDARGDRRRRGVGDAVVYAAGPPSLPLRRRTAPGLDVPHRAVGPEAPVAGGGGAPRTRWPPVVDVTREHAATADAAPR